MRHRCVITGIGLVSSIGTSRRAAVDRLRRLEHGFQPHEFLGNPNLPVKVTGPVPEFSFPTPGWRTWSWPDRYPIDRDLLRGLPPHGVFSVCALQDAVQDAALSLESLSDERTGLFCASAGSPRMMYQNMEHTHRCRGERGNPLGVVFSISGTLNFNLAAWLKIRGSNCGFVSACSSSTHAIGYACDEIRLGRQDRMLVVGAEEISAESVLPFSAMRALSNNPDPDTASRPFDQDRDGFVVSEGAAVLVLERADLAEERGVRPYGEIRGWSQASDGYNRAQSHPEGDGLLRCMSKALADAGRQLGDIGYINAHATSTMAGDRSEAIAISRLLEPIPVGRRPAISSIKALTGHGLSMAGALETALCLLAARQGFVPGCAHLKNPDPSCRGLFLPTESIDYSSGSILKNSSGFGGSNVSLVLDPL
jgi:3-oxoacyl-[acyl-carrier-protein] synthase-1